MNIVMEESKQYVVFVESTVSGERHYGQPVSLDEAMAILESNPRWATILQWIEPLPELSDLGITTGDNS
jgi:hypothetical protein